MKEKLFLSKLEIEEHLSAMEKDPAYRTEPGYVRESPLSKEMLVSFMDSHLFYLDKHPKLNPEHYLANLRTMLKIRPE